MPQSPPDRADAIVIGAGIIGAAVALELSRAGRSVLVVDAGPAPGMGSTGASSAIIRVHYSKRDSVIAARDCYYDWLSWSDYLQFEDPAGMIRFIRTGALVLDGADPQRRAFTDVLDSIGVTYHELDADGIAERFPALDPTVFGPPRLPEDEEFWRPGGEPLGGFYYEDAGYVDDPQLAAHNLCSAAAEHGARFLFRQQVTQIMARRNRVVGVRLSPGTEVLAPVVVNAAGPASDQLNVLAGVTEDMSVRSRPLRTETHEVPAPAGFEIGAAGTFVTDFDLGFAFRPHGNRRLHISSIEPASDPLEWVTDPWSFDPAATEEFYYRQTLRAARRMPSLRVPNRPVGIGALYDVTPDWTPIFDRSSLDGFYLACGTSGNAFKLAPMAGRALLAIITGTETALNYDDEPIRLKAPRVNGEIDLAKFSRLRPLDQTSPTNVIG